MKRAKGRYSPQRKLHNCKESMSCAGPGTALQRGQFWPVTSPTLTNQYECVCYQTCENWWGQVASWRVSVQLHSIWFAPVGRALAIRPEHTCATGGELLQIRGPAEPLLTRCFMEPINCLKSSRWSEYFLRKHWKKQSESICRGVSPAAGVAGGQQVGWAVGGSRTGSVCTHHLASIKSAGLLLQIFRERSGMACL